MGTALQGGHKAARHRRAERTRGARCWAAQLLGGLGRLHVAARKGQGGAHGQAPRGGGALRAPERSLSAGTSPPPKTPRPPARRPLASLPASLPSPALRTRRPCTPRWRGLGTHLVANVPAQRHGVVLALKGALLIDDANVDLHGRVVVRRDEALGPRAAQAEARARAGEGGGVRQVRARGERPRDAAGRPRARQPQARQHCARALADDAPFPGDVEVALGGCLCLGHAAQTVERRMVTQGFITFSFFFSAKTFLASRRDALGRFSRPGLWPLAAV